MEGRFAFEAEEGAAGLPARFGRGGGRVGGLGRAGGGVGGRFGGGLRRLGRLGRLLRGGGEGRGEAERQEKGEGAKRGSHGIKYRFPLPRLQIGPSRGRMIGFAFFPERP